MSHHLYTTTILRRITTLHHLKQTHAIAITIGHLPSSTTISAAFIIHYSLFNHPSSSLYLFHQSLPFNPHSPFLYNTLIRSSSHNGPIGLKVYNFMRGSGVRPDEYTFPFVIKILTDCGEVEKGFEVHGSVVKLGFDSDVYVGNTLLRFYGECCGIGDARKVFDEMSQRDVVSWNTFISVCSGTFSYNKGLSLFSQMLECCHISPNVVTIVSVLPVCAAVEDCVMTSEVHGYVVKTGFGFYVTVNNGLIDAYGKCGDLKGCKRVFDETVERNDVSWNAVITSLAYLDCKQDAMDFFKLMVDEGVVPNSVAVSSVLPVLVELECVRWGMEVHGFSIRRGMESDLFVANSLLDMYAKFGYSVKALNVFNKIDSKNTVSWNALVANHAQNGYELLALDVVRKMQAYGIIPGDVTLTNVLPAIARIGVISHGKEVHARSIRCGYSFLLIISNAIIDMYAKCGRIDLARNVFNISYKDRISYNTLISAHSHTNISFESLVLFHELLLKGLKPDSISFSGALSACANMAEIKKGREIHGVCARTLVYKHLIVLNSILDLYTKCGRMDLAKKVFDQIPDKDTASWNTIIMGYGMRGELDTAINLFEAMKDDHQVKRDSITFIAILSICSHGGLVDLGKKYFDEMKAESIEPTQTHYACMVDLLGRAGLMNEAVEIINGLTMEPDANVWGSLLGACRIHGNVDLGHWAAEHLFKLKPVHSGYYMLLSNMYAEAGRWHEADKIRELMKLRGVKKNPGFSCVQQADNG